MARSPTYPTLEAEISRKGIQKKAIAEKLGILPRAFSRKLSGETRFWWEEVLILHSIFPDISIERLMKKSSGEPIPSRRV